MCPSELSSNHVFRVLTFLLVVSMVLAPFQLGGALAQAAAPTEPGPSESLRQVRSLEIDRLGIVRPEGLAYTPYDNAFLVFQTAGDKPGATPTLFTVSTFGRLLATSGLDVPAASPSNMTFDAELGQLLFLSSTTGELVRVGITDGGVVDLSTIARSNIRGQGLSDPRGMAVDPATGRLLIFDAGAKDILTVDRSQAAAQEDIGSLQTNQIGRIDLAPLDVNGVRGLAVNPANSHLLLLDSAAQAIQELSPAGELVASYSYSDVGLRNPQAMVFAPTADLTDDPARMHLYVADAGQAPYAADIQELSFEPMPVVPEAVSVMPGEVIHTIDTSGYPAPDPSGITYLAPNRLLISDSEIEEDNMAWLWTGYNLYETDLAGTLLYSSTTWDKSSRAYSKEPTGLGLNTTNGHLYIVDDGEGLVWDVSPGAGGHFTLSSTRTSFDVRAFGSNDPEGVAYDPGGPNPSRPEALVIADGINAEVYRVHPTSHALLMRFDTEALGITDLEGIDEDPATGDLYLVGLPKTLVAQVSWDGVLKRLFDTTAAGLKVPGALAVGPSSGWGGSTCTGQTVYIADRGIDNDKDPTKNDGRVVEICLPAPTSGNVAPVVEAGPNQTIALPASANLNGTVTDAPGDTLPTMTTIWSKASGPGTVQFANAGAKATTASFSAAGTYVLRLTADDGELIGVDSVTVTVTGPNGQIVVDAPISYPYDDAEEHLNHSVSLTDSRLELVRYNGTDPAHDGDQTVGLRFRELAIPPGAAIQSAYVQFTTNMATTEATSLTIRGQNVGNAPVFAKQDYNISLRSTTAACALWSPVPWTIVNVAGADQQTPNLKGIVQSIVSSAGWASGNAMAFIITGSGQRVAKAAASDMRYAPRLHVEYLPSGTPVNAAPVVNAGQDQPGPGQQPIMVPGPVSLAGAACDDGLPTPPTLTYTWSMFSGPSGGTVTFDAPNALVTTATFSLPGTYVLRLTANDGSALPPGSDDVIITVEGPANTPPVVDAGDPQTITLPASASLDGTVTDDGLPMPAMLTYTWSKVEESSSTGTVTFGNASAVDTTASFSAAGTYTLRLTASDGQLSSWAEVIITVKPVNQAPVVNAGPDQTITLPENAILDGTVDDDGWPDPSRILTQAWSKVSGPGSVTFADASAVDTTASFSKAGTYVLSLTAYDGELYTSDEVIVTVNPAPRQSIYLPLIRR